jgi:hypothetical protein
MFMLNRLNGLYTKVPRKIETQVAETAGTLPSASGTTAHYNKGDHLVLGENNCPSYPIAPEALKKNWQAVEDTPNTYVSRKQDAYIHFVPAGVELDVHPEKQVTKHKLSAVVPDNAFSGKVYPINLKGFHEKWEPKGIVAKVQRFAHQVVYRNLLR